MLTAFLKDCVKFKGRLNRSRYWILAAKFGMLSALTLMGIVALSEFSRHMSIALAIILLGLVILVNLSITVRRLHDLNFTGSWLFVLVPLYVVSYVFVEDNSAGEVQNFAILTAFLVFAIYILLGFKRGTKGPNRFGPDPLE